MTLYETYFDGAYSKCWNCGCRFETEEDLEAARGQCPDCYALLDGSEY